MPAPRKVRRGDPRRAVRMHSYGIRDLNQLRSLRELRERYTVELDELAFAARLRREPELQAAVESWFEAGSPPGDWFEWEQRKHERLLAA